MKRLLLILLCLLLPALVNGQGMMIRNAVPVASDATLVNWWKLNEGTGTSITDYGSAPKTGTLGSNISWTTSGGKNVLAFTNSVGSNVTFSSTSYGTTHTVSMCVMFTGINMSGVDNVLFGGATANYAWYQNIGTDSYYNDGSNFAHVTSALTVNTWVRLTSVRSGTTVRFYADASQIGTDQTLASNNTPSFSAIGSYADGTFESEKQMSAVRVYTRALSSGDISGLPACPE